MNDRYVNVLNKYKQVCDKLKNNTLFINGRRQDTYKDIINLNIEFMRLENEYFAILKINEISGTSNLEFFLSNQEYSKSFVSYVLSFLTSEDKYLYKTINKISISDYHSYLLNVQQISIDGMLIDKKILDFIKKHFKNIVMINFSNSTIKNNCHINDLDIEMNFYNCEIENITSFNYCNQKITIIGGKIDMIEHTTINSDKIILDKFEDEILENLFFKCQFPNLLTLQIGNNHVDESKTYDKCLNFLPYACPKLLSLSISGKISSFDFLYHFHALSKCEIMSIDDSIESYQIYTPYITNDLERQKIIDDSHRIIKNDLDIHLAINDKLQEIINIMNTVRYTEEEKTIYMKRRTLENLNTFKHSLENKIDYFYLYDQNLKMLYLSIDNTNEKIIFNDKLYIIKQPFKGKNIEYKKTFIVSKPFIYHASNIPIMFSKHNYLDEDFIKEALKMEELYIAEMEDNEKDKKLLKTL